MAASLARGDDLPRYRLEAGDELRFDRLGLAAGPSGAVESRVSEKVDIVCLEEHEGRWLVLVDAVRIVDGRVEPVRAAVLEIDRRGARTVSAAQWRELLGLESALDALPVLQSSLDPGPEWGTPPDPCGRVYRCRTGAADPEHGGQLRITFRRSDPSHVSEILGEERFGRFWYDPRQAIVTRAEVEERGLADGRTMQSKMKLRARVRRESDWVRARTEEARAYVLAAENAARLEQELFRADEPIELILSRIARVWSSLATEVGGRDESPFRGIAAAAAQRAAEAAPQLREAAGIARSWLDQPAPEWELRVPGSGVLGSREFLGRPRVELFWSTDAPDGVRMLAAGRGLQVRLSERGVPVLCLHAGRDESAMRRVAERCGGGLRVVQADALASRAGVAGVPAVRWVDERGVVRRAAVGWRADLAWVVP